VVTTFRPGQVPLALFWLLLASGCQGELGREQPQTDLELQRSAYLDWLLSEDNSPYRAIARIQLAGVIELGPEDSHLPLEGIEPHAIEPRPGSAALVGPSGNRVLAPYRALPLGRYSLSLQGEGSKRVVLVYDSERQPPEPAGWYPPDSTWRFEVPLSRDDGGSVPMLTLDGLEVSGTIVGSVEINGTQLQVRNVPQPGTDESGLEIYFRDETSGMGSYPAGRFVPVYRSAEGRYLVDFNRARSPFCAYSSVYPCPIPWRGNNLPLRVTAGERYSGGGLEVDFAAD